MLFAVAAPSGTGKTSIVKEVLNQNPDLVFSVSATTRKRRENEIDGKDYYFISEDSIVMFTSVNCFRSIEFNLEGSPAWA